MVPMYAARVENLTHHETVTALCTSCGHVAEVPVADLWRKFPPFKRITEIRLWCTRCGERDRVELDATKALTGVEIKGLQAPAPDRPGGPLHPPIQSTSA
jgi:hypothetical protein